MFSPGIVEALPYTTTAQASYPLPVNPLTGDLEATAKATAGEILNAPYLLSFLTSKQQKTLGGLPKGLRHPATALLRNYLEEGTPDHTGPPMFAPGAVYHHL